MKKQASRPTPHDAPLDLKAYPWPKVTGADIAFPTFNTDPKLLAEATRRGYDDYPEKPGVKMFTTLFYSGGRILYREDVPKEHLENVRAYLRSFMGSWAPKHEHKTAICGMLLDEIATGVEPAPKKAA